MKTIGLMMLLVGAAGSAAAACILPIAPEVDSASAIGALALLSGALLVIRGRHRK